METNEKEHKLNCLARWVLSHFKTSAGRRASLERMKKTHGAGFIEDLKARMTKEWGKKNGTRR